MDGLKAGPVVLGQYTTPANTTADSNTNNWLSVAKAHIEERMQRYSETETSFALLSIG